MKHNAQVIMNNATYTLPTAKTIVSIYRFIVLM